MFLKRGKIIFNIHLIIGLIATIPLLIMILAAPFASYREEIKSAINEKYINLVKIGDTFKFKLDLAGEEKEVKISLIYPEIKRETRKFYAEAYDMNLKPGMFGQGKVLIGNSK